MSTPIAGQIVPAPALAPTGQSLGRSRRRKSRRPLRMTGLRASMDAVRMSLYGITLVSISAVHMYLGPVKYTRPTVTLLLLAVVTALLQRKAMAWSNLMRSWPSKAIMAFFVIAMGSALFGLSLGGSFFFILDRYSKVLLVFFLTVAAVRNARDLALLMWSYVISVGVLLILAMTVLEMETTNSGLGRMEGGATMYDANDLGMVLLMGIPIALLCFFTAARSFGRWTAAAVVLGIPAVIALTGSRGAMVGLVACAPFLFRSLSRYSIGKRLGVVIPIVGALILAAPDGYWKQMETIINPSGDYNVSTEYGRMGIAKRGMGYMLRYPLFGVGIANFPRAEGTISPIAAARQAEGLSVEWIAPHNTYVQVGAELGVIALVIWLSLLWGATIGLWRLRKRIPASWDTESPERRFLREACLFLPISFIAFGVTSYFLSHAYTPPPYIFLAFFATLVVLVKRELALDKRRLLQSRAAQHTHQSHGVA